MVPQETSEIMQALHDSRAEFHAATEGVSEEQAKTKPAPGRWSVLDCVEHVAVVEGHFLRWIENPLAEPAPPVDHEKEANLMAGVAGRATRAQAPDLVLPTGRFATLAEALAQFDAVRARNLAFAQQQGAGVYALSATHPFFGPINGAETLVLMAAHCRRHAAQIREVRAEI
jgi:uncharacterized damage-inducible protein DinB